MQIPVCAPATRTVFDYLIAVVPVCSTVATVLVAGYVAFVSWSQAKTASRKLSLDLYDRRFRIYMRSVDFYQALLTWPATGNKGGIHDKFIRAKLESTFLFKSSDIRSLMDEMDSRAMSVIGYWENGRLDHALSGEMERRKDEAISWFENALKELEVQMTASMSFHDETLQSR